MYSLEDLQKQNQEISQLCDVLSVLMEKPALHDNPFVGELMERFKEKVWIHLVFEDNTLYASLLQHPDQLTSETVKSFHDSAKQIKHQFNTFVKHWRTIASTDEEHDELSKECREIFSMIRDRVDYENTQIFPLVKE